jgi:uncharacterized DUF497 family protein
VTRTFQWDERKAETNRFKHGIRFEEAESVFEDPLARIDPDPDHSEDEGRELIFGHSDNGKLLLVNFVERGGTIRIISARYADKEERKRYEEDVL